MSFDKASAPQERSLSMITAKDMIVTGGTFNLFTETRAPIDHRKVICGSFKDYIVSNAAHDAADPTNLWPRCHPNTRTSTLEALERQVQDTDMNSVITWVSGGPGTGKSSIAGSLCDILQAKGQLGASFTFRPDVEQDPRRGFITTIAFQLAVSIPAMQPRIATALEENPFVFQQSPEIQMDRLIVVPLLDCELEFPRVVVVDGLDKYGNSSTQCRMLSILGESAVRLGGRLKIFIFTGAQSHISSAFQSDLFKPITKSTNLDDAPTIRNDSRIVLEKEVGQITTLDGLSSPSEEALINLLISCFTGIFNYPDLAFKHIETTLATFTGLDSSVGDVVVITATIVPLGVFFLIDHCV